MKKFQPTPFPSNDLYAKKNESPRITVHIGGGLNVPLYSSAEAEAFALGAGQKILTAFKMEKVVQALIHVYEQAGYADVIFEIERLNASSELVLALLLQRRNERVKIARQNANSKLKKNHHEQLREEATTQYLSVKTRKNKDDFAHEFSLQLETKKQTALRKLTAAKGRLSEHTSWQAEGGAQRRRKPENVTKLKALREKVQAAETQASFKVYKPSTIRDVWLKGL